MFQARARYLSTPLTLFIFFTPLSVVNSPSTVSYKLIVISSIAVLPHSLRLYSLTTTQFASSNLHLKHHRHPFSSHQSLNSMVFARGFFFFFWFVDCGFLLLHEQAQALKLWRSIYTGWPSKWADFEDWDEFLGRAQVRNVKIEFMYCTPHFISKRNQEENPAS